MLLNLNHINYFFWNEEENQLIIKPLNQSEYIKEDMSLSEYCKFVYQMSQRLRMPNGSTNVPTLNQQFIKIDDAKVEHYAVDMYTERDSNITKQVFFINKKRIKNAMLDAKLGSIFKFEDNTVLNIKNIEHLERINNKFMEKVLPNSALNFLGYHFFILDKNNVNKK